jgi:hypothetical protein
MTNRQLPLSAKTSEKKNAQRMQILLDGTMGGVVRIEK